VIISVSAIAAIKELHEDAVIDAVEENQRRLFGL
jgi:hypothetical protein